MLAHVTHDFKARALRVDRIAPTTRVLVSAGKVSRGAITPQCCMPASLAGFTTDADLREILYNISMLAENGRSTLKLSYG